MSNQRPPLPPFTKETARQKVRATEDVWNSRKPERVSLAYSLDSQWRNRNEFLTGRPEIVAFLACKWERELDYRLIEEVWAWQLDRIAVRFAMSGETTRATGSTHTETRTGNSTPMA